MLQLENHTLAGSKFVQSMVDTGAQLAALMRDPDVLSVYAQGSYVTDELIFDRATSTLKAEVYLIIKDGKLIDSGGTTYLTSGLVNSTHSTPGH